LKFCIDIKGMIDYSTLNTSFKFIGDDEIALIGEFRLNDIPGLNLKDIKFGGSRAECGTCGEINCIGHPAYLDLGTYIFYPKFIKYILEAFNKTCISCGTRRTQSNKDKRCIEEGCEGVFHSDYIFQKTKKIGFYRANKSADFFFDAKSVKEILRKKNNREHKFIISRILIPVLEVRSMKNSDWSSPYAKYIEKIVGLVSPDSSNFSKTSKTSKITQNVSERNMDNVQLNIYNAFSDLCDFVYSDLLSKKEGMPRRIVLGKTRDRSARLVITPNPYLKINEIEIPYLVSRVILLNERVNRYNIDFILYNLENYTYKDTYIPVRREDIVIGMEFSRYLRDGDICFFNRPPTLSKLSIIVVVVKIKKKKSDGTFSMNIFLTTIFNADFDGDEMNTFFILREDAKAEAMTLCSVEAILSDSNNHHLFEPKQSVAYTLYELSIENKKIDAAKMMQYQWQIENCTPNLKTSYELLSLLFPSTLNFKSEDFIIEGGRLISGPIKKFHRIYKYMKPSEITTMLYKLGLLSILHNQYNPLTIHMKDLFLKDEDRKEFQSEERTISDMLHWIDQTMEERYANSPLLKMVKSGAKGTMMNILQILGSIGKQYLGKEAIENVFINSNFVEGLSANDYFEHMKTTNRSIALASMETAGPGYLQRLMTYTTNSDVVLSHMQILGDQERYIRYYPLKNDTIGKDSINFR